VNLLHLLVIGGGLVSLAGGAALLLLGDRMRERDAAAGRTGPNYPTPEKQRSQALMFVGIGVAALLLALIL